MTAVVEAESLTKRIGEVSAVTDLSFTLEAGTITGCLGPNGAGNTTTLRMVLGLASPTSGRALVFDGAYAELEHPALRGGVVLEATGFHPGRSGRDHLRMQRGVLVCEHPTDGKASTGTQHTSGCVKHTRFVAG